MRKKQVKPQTFIGQIVYKLNPSIGKLYENHLRFFNDGIVELICLLIVNAWIFFLSLAGYVGWWLVLLNLVFVTPLTFVLKFILHKHWVWKKDVEK